MAREIKIPHERLKNSQTITDEMERVFAGQGLNLHVHEVEQMDDDFKKRERVLRVKNTRYFVMGD